MTYQLGPQKAHKCNGEIAFNLGSSLVYKLAKISYRTASHWLVGVKKIHDGFNVLPLFAAAYSRRRFFPISDLPIIVAIPGRPLLDLSIKFATSSCEILGQFG